MPTSGNPQLENGFLRIANELYEVLTAMPLTSREYKVILAIIRITYGWGKKVTIYHGETLARMTGLDPANISRTCRDLASKNVLHFFDSPGQSTTGPVQGNCNQSTGNPVSAKTLKNNLVGLNKHYLDWNLGSVNMRVASDFMTQLRSEGYEFKEGLTPVEWTMLTSWIASVGMDPFVDVVKRRYTRTRPDSLAYFITSRRGKISAFEDAYFKAKEALWREQKSLEERFFSERSGELEPLQVTLERILPDGFGPE